MSLDEMIAAAKKRLEDATDDEAKLQATAEVEALSRVLEAGYTKTQKDLDRVDKQNKEALNALRQDVQKTLGAGWDEVKQTLQETLTGEEGEGEEGEPANLVARFEEEIQKRDAALATERKERLQFQRELKHERLVGELNRRFESLELQKPYQTAAREFVSPRLDAIVDKAMEGEDVSEDLKAQAERVKELSPVWFEKPQDASDLLLPPPNTRSPQEGEPKRLTDQERAERAEIIV